jgi:hypothetical protein
MRFRQFEVVRLIDGIPADGIAPGTLAVVTDVYDADPALHRPPAYELEIHRPGLPLYTTSAPQDALEPLLTPGRHELWIMPEYECHSFWATDGTTSGIHDNVSAESLGLSAALVTDIAAWENAYESTYVPADPASSGFRSAAAEEAFRVAGQVLAERVTAELGSGWSVVYRYGEPEQGAGGDGDARGL